MGGVLIRSQRVKPTVRRPWGKEGEKKVGLQGWGARNGESKK